MNQFVLLLLCLGAGALLQRVKAFPADASKGLNGFIIYLALPAITLVYVPQLEWSWQLLLPALMSWIVFGLAWAGFHFLGKILRWDRATTGCVVLCCGLGNTSFVGFPLIEHFYGKEGLATAVLCDQPGAFLVLATLGMWVIGIYAGKETSLRSIGRRIAAFPPFIAFLVAVVLSLSNLDIPSFLLFSLERIGATLAPLALVSVGLQLRRPPASFPAVPFSLGLVYKLGIAPAVIALLYMSLLGQRGTAIEITVLEAAMAPMITPAILAAENNLNPPLAALFVGIGIPLSLLTVWVWFHFLI